nr:hypothetical protein [Paracoccus saliphilus]
MNPKQVKTSIAGMSDADLCEVIVALGRAYDQATQLKVSARLPECAAFGAIARDLEYSLSIIRRSAPEDPAAQTLEVDGPLASARASFAAVLGRENTNRP